MSSAAKKLLDEILQLPKEERELLAEEVWLSLHDEAADENVDEAWEKEIKKRLDEIDSGKVKLIPWANVEKEIEEKLRAQRKRSSRSAA